MTFSLVSALLTVGLLHATDVGMFPPGHKPFHSPKAPQPNGVLAADACFGFHATRWTPWYGACAQVEGSAKVGQSCTNKAIILFEEPSAVKSAPAPSAIAPAPEANKPMPPAKK